MWLKEFLEPLEVTRKEFARHMGWIYDRLREQCSLLPEDLRSRIESAAANARSTS